MLTVYRICHGSYTSLDGLGGLYGNSRWHEKGHPIIYTAWSQSLAALERLAHESIETMPLLSMLTIHIPHKVSCVEVGRQDLPEGWDNVPDTGAGRQFGSDWLKQRRSACLILPSVIIPSEKNILVNPLHADAHRIRVVKTEPFAFDPRLLSKEG